MKQLAAFWSGTPRFVRGWFLGNFFYTLLAVLSFISINNDSLDQSGLSFILGLLMWPLTRSSIGPGVILYHIAWCLLGAVFVEGFGASKGITVLAGTMYGIGFLLFAFLLIAFLLSF